MSDDQQLRINTVDITLRVMQSPHAKREDYGKRRGFTLIELVVVLTVIGILTSLSVPSFRRSREQSHADLAASRLKLIWSAQQLYWLEHRQYANNLATLDGLGLINPEILSNATPYVFTIQNSGSTTFTARATRRANSTWSGWFEVNQTGTVTGAIVGDGVEIRPAM